jgi:hypothetical protein
MNGISANPYEVQEAVDVLNKDQNVSRLQKAQTLVVTALDQWVAKKTFQCLVFQRHTTLLNSGKKDCKPAGVHQTRCWECAACLSVAAQSQEKARSVFVDIVDELALIRSSIDREAEVLMSTPGLVYCPVDQETEASKYEERDVYEH